MNDLDASRRLARGVWVGVMGWVLGCSPLTAALTNVDIGPYGFSPSAVAINVNDKVRWAWVSNYHSTTSTTGLWDSGEYNTGHTFTNTFTSPGTFPYYCTYHLFTGSVTVVGAAVPPAITITNPPDGAVLSAPASLVLKATAESLAGSVTNVQFFEGATLLGAVPTIPYSIPVAGLQAGNYAFAAVATDNLGQTATNSITVHVINPAPVALAGAQPVSATGFRFSYAADPGLSYVVQRSQDLRNWIGIGTNAATSNPVVFQDNNASGTAGFYRVWRLPNP